MSQVKKDGDARQDHDPDDKEPQLKTRGPQIQLLRADEVKPADSRDQAEQTRGTDPWLRRYGLRQQGSEITHEDGPPGWKKEPVRRQKSNRSQTGEQKEHAVGHKAEGEPRWTDQEQEPKQTHHDAFGPFLCAAGQEAGQHRQKSGGGATTLSSNGLASPGTRLGLDWIWHHPGKSNMVWE